MGSSLRNSIHRRNHKERSQLASRAKLGLLEKHSDYVKRARDYHTKQDALLRLQRKAADRNKDEFYFSMVKERTKKGVHVHERGNRALPTDIVKVLKTQDENYIRTMRLSNLKKIDSLKDWLTTLADLVQSDFELQDEDDLEVLRKAGILPATGPSEKKHKAKHIVFVDNESQAQEYAHRGWKESGSSSSNVTHEEEEENQEVDLGWTQPKSKKSKKAKQPVLPQYIDNMDGEDPAEDLEKGSMSKSQLLKELAARLHRDTHLSYAQRELEMQRLLMSKGARSKISHVEKVAGDSDSDDEDALDARGGRKVKRRPVIEALYKPRVYKWKLERKK